MRNVRRMDVRKDDLMMLKTQLEWMMGSLNNVVDRLDILDGVLDV